MPVAKAFELYVFKSRYWEIDGIFDNRTQAVSAARTAFDSKPYRAVRVVEERTDPTTGETTTKIVYQVRVEDARKEKDWPLRKRPAPAAAEVFVREDPPLTVRVAATILGVGVGLVVGLVGLAFLVDVVR